MPRRQFVREVERLVKEPAPSWQLDADLRGRRRTRRALSEGTGIWDRDLGETSARAPSPQASDPL